MASSKPTVPGSSQYPHSPWFPHFSQDFLDRGVISKSSSQYVNNEAPITIFVQRKIKEKHLVKRDSLFIAKKKICLPYVNDFFFSSNLFTFSPIPSILTKNLNQKKEEIKNKSLFIFYIHY
jgi:hypothetical protein